TNPAATYVGNEDYPRLLRDYLKVQIAPNATRPQHSYIADWQDAPATTCPSAQHNQDATLINAPNTFNPHSSFQRWGAMRLFYVPAGLNVLWHGTVHEAYLYSGNGWMPSRHSDRATKPIEVAMITEPLWTNPLLPNNHRAQGLNAVAMDGSGRWY